MTIRRMLALASMLAAVQCSAQQPGPPRGRSVEQAVATITEADFARKVGVIADDSMAGRDTPSLGLDATADWIASELRRLGLRGGAPGGGFIQRYPLRSVALDEAASSIAAGSTRLAYGSDVLPLRGDAGSVVATASVVLVSGSGRFGRAAAEAVAGRHALVIPAEGGAGIDRRALALVLDLADAGAASVWVASPASDAQWATLRSRAFRAVVTKGWGDDAAPAPSGRPTPLLQVRAAAVERVLDGRGVDLRALAARAGRAVQVEELDGLTATVTHTVRDEALAAPNVVGILEGSDPALRAEHVVFSGHMDHVGVGSPDQNGDSIFNGADDDASGTVAVLEVAEAMASLATAPRRSMIFLLVSGEEKGLWGSEWYAAHPSVPIDGLVADLNTDMVGRNWTDTIVAIGKEHSNLGETLNAVNARHPELNMTAIDDLWPDENFYFRSDHFNFARRGVPILFFFNGTHEDYHGRDDEPDRIDAEKASRIARLVFYLGLEIANADARPAWRPESYARIVTGGR